MVFYYYYLHFSCGIYQLLSNCINILYFQILNSQKQKDILLWRYTKTILDVLKTWRRNAHILKSIIDDINRDGPEQNSPIPYNVAAQTTPIYVWISMKNKSPKLN